VIAPAVAVGSEAVIGHYELPLFLPNHVSQDRVTDNLCNLLTLQRNCYAHAADAEARRANPLD
jgi:hypothetical protein